MAKGYLTPEERKRMQWYEKHRKTTKGNMYFDSDKEQKDYNDLKKRWDWQKSNYLKKKEAKEKASAEKADQAKKDADPFSGKKQTELSSDRFKGGSITMDTGGGQPISKGKTWPDEPDKERVEQPRSGTGQFTFNSLAGLDKKDKRDRAKGTGDYGDDPALTSTQTGVDDNAIGKEYLGRKKSGGGGFKKGEVFKLKDGSTVVFTHDISLEDFYKYYMTNYKDKAGEIRNALYENGLLVRIGQKYGEGKDAGKVADISGSESSLGSKKRYKEFEAASQRWANFVKDKAAQAEISKKEEFANTIGKFAVKHPGVPNANNPGYASKSTPKQPASSAPASAAQKPKVNAGAQSISDSQAMNLAQSNLNMFMKNNNAALVKAASHFNMSIKDIAQMIADGDLNFSEIASL